MYFVSRKQELFPCLRKQNESVTALVFSWSFSGVSQKKKEITIYVDIFAFIHDL